MSVVDEMTYQVCVCGLLGFDPKPCAACPRVLCTGCRSDCPLCQQTFCEEHKPLDDAAVCDGCTWMASKDSPVALIVASDPGRSERSQVEWQRFKVEGQRKENARRDRMTPEVCGLVLMAYTETRWVYARQIARAMGMHPMIENLVADDAHPSYTEMRNFLVGEYDAHYIVACQAAFARVGYYNRQYRSGWLGDVLKQWNGRYAPQVDRGWL